MPVDDSTILQASVTLAAFLVGINAFLPKGLDEEWFAFWIFLIPSPVLFLITSMLAAFQNSATLSMFAVSTVILILLFVSLGSWTAYEKYSEHVMKRKLKIRNPDYFSLLVGRNDKPQQEEK